MGENLVPWSDLPKELLPIIGKNLETRVDVLRFRSVCNFWRSSLPPFTEISPRLPLPSPFGPFPSFSGTSEVEQVFVSQSTTYRLQPSSSSSSSSNGWLIMIEESEAGKTRLLSPISNLQIRYLDPVSFPKVLNLLDFRTLELGKSYKLRCLGDESVVRVMKVVLFRNSACSRVEDSVIFGLYPGHRRLLSSAKYGDEEWTFIGKQNTYYDDIIVYKGKIYVVDTLGTVSWIDSSLKLIPFPPPLSGLARLGNKKHLVESCGELYVVDRYIDEEHSFSYYGPEDFLSFVIRPKTLDFKVYKLDEEWGDEWVVVKNLGDRVFILGNDCSFSVSGREFAGCKGNCIYFTDENDIGVFCLENGIIDKKIDFQDYSHIFRPPPT